MSRFKVLLVNLKALLAKSLGAFGRKSRNPNTFLTSENVAVKHHTSVFFTNPLFKCILESSTLFFLSECVILEETEC